MTWLNNNNKYEWLWGPLMLWPLSELTPVLRGQFPHTMQCSKLLGENCPSSTRREQEEWYIERPKQEKGDCISCLTPRKLQLSDTRDFAKLSSVSHMPVPLENKSVRQLFPSPPPPLDGHSGSSAGCEILLRQRSRATPPETCQVAPAELLSTGAPKLSHWGRAAQATEPDPREAGRVRWPAGSCCLPDQACVCGCHPTLPDALSWFEKCSV